MAARIATKATAIEHDAWAGWRDAEAALNDWAEAQLDACTAGLGQIAEAQQAMLSFWLGLAEASAGAWSGAGAVGPNAPMLTALADAWSPWLPFVQRGGEQLG